MPPLTARMNARVRRAWIAGILCAVIGVAGADAVADESATLSEVKVKAAFLYKFTGYVEWPPSAFAVPNAPLVFGVMGDDALADELTHMVQGRASGARPVTVVRPKAFEPLPQLHVLFIGRAESDRLGPLVRIARARPILVVTDTEGAIASNSMINFTVVDGHVRFEVGLASAQRSGLTLSSRLLAVATSVATRMP